MKLKDWADKQGISYLTAWRWFKAGDSRLSGAYQSDTGTIIVPDETDNSESVMLGNTTNNDIMSTVLKKTVELSKTNASVEEFAAWILSNFTLKPISMVESPKYSKNKPKPEQVQAHFKQFLKPNAEKPKTNMFLAEPSDLDQIFAQSDDLTAQELVDEIHQVGRVDGVSINPTEAPEVSDLMKDLSSAISSSNPSTTLSNNVTMYGDVTGGLVARSLDLTPQLNYIGSADCTYTLGNTFQSNSLQGTSANTLFVASDENRLGSFQPFQKEIESIKKVASAIPAITEKPRRGRKPSKGKKQ